MAISKAQHLKLLACVLLLLMAVTDSWIVKQPQENVWVTLAKALRLENMCLSMGSAQNPLSTCLVGIPLSQNDYPFIGKYPKPVDVWDEWTKILPRMQSEPQELDLLGSSPAKFCINFFYRTRNKYIQESIVQKSTHRLDISPNNKIYKRKNWCNYTADTVSMSTREPRTLPKGVFLLCGDRAWAGIPSHLQGGPCTLGKLTILAPNMTLLQNWQNQSENLARKKRQLATFDADCDSQISDWSRQKQVLMSIFLPWIAAAKALGELSHLEYWLGKQANLTSAILSDLLEDEETIKKATLQNRAAIDFLLLAHGHGCNEFHVFAVSTFQPTGEASNQEYEPSKEL